MCHTLDFIKFCQQCCPFFFRTAAFNILIVYFNVWRVNLEDFNSHVLMYKRSLSSSKILNLFNSRKKLSILLQSIQSQVKGKTSQHNSLYQQLACAVVLEAWTTVSKLILPFNIMAYTPSFTGRSSAFIAPHNFNLSIRDFCWLSAQLHSTNSSWCSWDKWAGFTFVMLIPNSCHNYCDSWIICYTWKLSMSHCEPPWRIYLHWIFVKH